MPFGGPRKTWSQMTNREIVVTLSAFTLIAGVVSAACIHSFATGDSGLAKVVPAAGVLFVVSVVVCSYVEAVSELRRRRKD